VVIGVKVCVRRSVGEMIDRRGNAIKVEGKGGMPWTREIKKIV